MMKLNCCTHYRNFILHKFSYIGCDIIYIYLDLWFVSDSSYFNCKLKKLSYVYWTMHHLDSWIETNLMSLALLFHYLLLNMFRVLIHPSSGACDLFVELFHGLYRSGSMCVGVMLWFGWGGVVSVCRLHRTRTIQPMK